MTRLKRCRRSARDERARQEWLRQAAQWDGQAIVYDPMSRKNVLADWYKDHVAAYVMWDFDRQTPFQRKRIANSADGYGNEAPVVIHR